MVPYVSKKNITHAKNLLSVFRKQWWPKEKIEEWQNEKIRSLIAHAYHHVPFHRKRMDERRLKPEDIQTSKDLVKLPFCTKTEMREGYPGQVVAEGYSANNCIVERTSGSTGRFLDVLHTTEAFNYSQSLGFRQYYDLGYRPWHVRAYFRWEPIGYRYPFEGWGVLRKVYIPILADPEEQLKLLLQCKPRIITGYPSSLNRFVRSVAKEKIRLIRPHFVISNSEQLAPHVAEAIRDAFGCEVYDEYSSFEVFQTAFECRHHSYHIVSDNVVLECVDRQGNPLPAGEPGELVATGLMNKAMPFIRYRTNDYGVLSNRSCACGRTFPLLEKLIGRVDDYIVLPSKKLVDPPIISGFLFKIDDLKEFQLKQERIDQFVIQVLSGRPEKNDFIRSEILRLFHETFPGEAFDLSVVFVEQIKAGYTGKKKSIVSDPELLKQASLKITA